MLFPYTEYWVKFPVLNSRFLLISILVLVSCSIGSGEQTPTDEQIDFLGGGGTATAASPTDVDSDTYVDSLSKEILDHKGTHFHLSKQEYRILRL